MVIVQSLVALNQALNGKNNMQQLEIIFNPDRLPHAPYCTDELGKLAVRRFKSAINRRYIQVNPPKLYFWLVLDVDRPAGALAWEDCNLPSPNFATTNPENGHAHLVYGLSAPVLTTEAARQAPLRYLNAIRTAYTALTKADQGYTGLITKNPLNDHWITLFGHGHLYDLGELAEHVPDLNRYSDHVGREAVGIGRNVSLFDTVRRWAYTEIRLFRGVGRKYYETWLNHVYDKVAERNGDFSEPLGLSEVKAIAKSIGKWVWQRDPNAESNFLQKQAYKASLGGKAGGRGRSLADENKRATARLMKAKGMTQQAIADELQVTQQTVSNWLKIQNTK